MEEEIVEQVAEDIVEEASEVAQAATAGKSVFIDNAGETIQSATSEVLEETSKTFHFDKIKEFFTLQNLTKVLVVIVVVAVIFAVYKILRHLIKKGSERGKLQKHTAMILSKAVTYVFYILVGMYVLSLFGVNLSAIWGAAGVAGLAIGFAAQTSVSNIISGIFVLSEKALKTGDYIDVGGTAGTVDSIGLLSVKIHTLDNQVVRIPNSSIIGGNLVNYSAVESRRMVFEIPLDYNDDMEKALEAVMRVPAMCSTVLKKPEPLAYYDGFGDAVNLRLAVWFKGKDFYNVKNEVYINVVKEFHKEGLTIPFTRYDVKLVDDKKNAPVSQRNLKSAEKVTVTKAETSVKSPKSSKSKKSSDSKKVRR